MWSQPKSSNEVSQHCNPNQLQTEGTGCHVKYEPAGAASTAKTAATNNSVIYLSSKVKTWIESKRLLNPNTKPTNLSNKRPCGPAYNIHQKIPKKQYQLQYKICNTEETRLFYKAIPSKGANGRPYKIFERNARWSPRVRGGRII